MPDAHAPSPGLGLLGKILLAAWAVVFVIGALAELLDLESLRFSVARALFLG